MFDSGFWLLRYTLCGGNQPQSVAIINTSADGPLLSEHLVLPEGE